MGTPPNARRAAVSPALCSAVLLTLVAVEWRPLTDWVWDPLTVRLVPGGQQHAGLLYRPSGTSPRKITT
ncbi:hypothetical protein [Streptomyces sp. NPDC051576]|uniref:hypothetical protein n=1 Tax=Streptomyces sp. NPDC051576 TaxID=3155803 RepID=UPI00343B1C20